MIVAISAVSESGDHYLWCETGTVEEVIERVSSCEDFAYLGQIDVVALRGGSTGDLKEKLLEAIDSRYENQ